MNKNVREQINRKSVREKIKKMNLIKIARVNMKKNNVGGKMDSKSVREQTTKNSVIDK